MSGFLLFLITELIVNNFFPDRLWKRRNCGQVKNVAYYALIAELITMGILDKSFNILVDPEIVFLNSIVLGMYVGIAVAFSFVALSRIFYIPDKKTV